MCYLKPVHMRLWNDAYIYLYIYIYIYIYVERHTHTHTHTHTQTSLCVQTCQSVNEGQQFCYPAFNAMTSQYIVPLLIAVAWATTPFRKYSCGLNLTLPVTYKPKLNIRRLRISAKKKRSASRRLQ